MKKDNLTANQRYALLILESLWRQHHCALTITQISAKGYSIGNTTLSSLRRLGLIGYIENEGWYATGAGRAAAQLLHELLSLREDRENG